jgi:hypothetical protein
MSRDADIRLSSPLTHFSDIEHFDRFRRNGLTSYDLPGQCPGTDRAHDACR